MTFALGRIGSGVAGRRGSLWRVYYVLHSSGSRERRRGGGGLRAVMTEEWQLEAHLRGRQRPSRGRKNKRMREGGQDKKEF